VRSFTLIAILFVAITHLVACGGRSQEPRLNPEAVKQEKLITKTPPPKSQIQEVTEPATAMAQPPKPEFKLPKNINAIDFLQYNGVGIAMRAGLPSYGYSPEIRRVTINETTENFVRNLAITLGADEPLIDYEIKYAIFDSIKEELAEPDNLRDLYLTFEDVLVSEYKNTPVGGRIRLRKILEDVYGKKLSSELKEKYEELALAESSYDYDAAVDSRARFEAAATKAGFKYIHVLLFRLRRYFEGGEPLDGTYVELSNRFLEHIALPE
jgi:hypothetical protein